MPDPSTYPCRTAVLLVCFSAALHVQGSGLEIDEFDADGQLLTAEVSWQHSWSYPDTVDPANHDAVWLFCKGRASSGAAWEHVPLFGAAADGTVPLELRTPMSESGVLLRRTDHGEGDIEDARITMEVPAEYSAYHAFRLFGIEMVYIRPGAFYVGDTTSNNTLSEYPGVRPYYIENESEIVSGNIAGALWAAGYPPGGDVPAAYPKGTAGYYSMKYEISQRQYADFLNTLSPPQQDARRLSTGIEAPCFDGDHVDGERNVIVYSDGEFGCDANGNGIWNEADDGQFTACNFLTWSHFTAYLDWAGLRPMTELEFEKTCRGPGFPVPGEMAWGSSAAVNTTQVVLEWTAGETAADPVPPGSGKANFGYCFPSGPLRCGFAAAGETGRAAAGASWYGVMEMSGNLWELCVPLSSGGLAFDGRHGDGRLDASGAADVPMWSTGGHRGGGWNSGILSEFNDLAVSNRFYIYLDPDQSARGTAGGRGVISESEFP